MRDNLTMKDLIEAVETYQTAFNQPFDEEVNNHEVTFSVEDGQFLNHRSKIVKVIIDGEDVTNFLTIAHMRFFTSLLNKKVRGFKSDEEDIETSS